jgi:ABC-type uncharacterized transport system permease subunit
MDDDRAAQRCWRFALTPQTALGRRAAVVLAAGIALFALATLLANAGGLGGSPWLALMMIPAIAAILCGTVVAAIAVVRMHERSGIALLPLLFGLALVVLLIGELIPPYE